MRPNELARRQQEACQNVGDRLALVAQLKEGGLARSDRRPDEIRVPSKEAQAIAAPFDIWEIKRSDLAGMRKEDGFTPVATDQPALRKVPGKHFHELVANERAAAKSLLGHPLSDLDPGDFFAAALTDISVFDPLNVEVTFVPADVKPPLALLLVEPVFEDPGLSEFVALLLVGLTALRPVTLTLLGSTNGVFSVLCDECGFRKSRYDENVHAMPLCQSARDPELLDEPSDRDMVCDGEAARKTPKVESSIPRKERLPPDL
jgi:hypothetical protein